MRNLVQSSGADILAHVVCLALGLGLAYGRPASFVADQTRCLDQVAFESGPRGDEERGR